MKSPFKYALGVLPLLGLTGCAAKTSAPGLTSDSKTWFIYAIFMALAYGGAFMMLVWMPLHSFLVVDWKKRSVKSKWKTGSVLGYYYFILHMLAIAIFLRDYTNNMYSIEVANDGIHYRSWDRGDLIKWSDLYDVRATRDLKGRDLLLVESKNSSPLKIYSLAYWHWDEFTNNVKTHMSRAHCLNKFLYQPNGPPVY